MNTRCIILVTCEGTINVPTLDSDGLVSEVKAIHYHYNASQEPVSIPTPLFVKLNRLGYARGISETS